MIDSHAHITYSFEKNGKKSNITSVQLRNALFANVTEIIAILLESYDQEMDNILKVIPDGISIYFACGIHPEELKDKSEKIKVLDNFIRNNRNKIHAIGECGIDYYDATSPKEDQFELFNTQINLANELNLPLIIHTRPSSLDATDAYDDMYSLLKNNTPKNNFVLHCYSSGKDSIKRFLNMGAFVGFAGNCTFPKAENIREAMSYVPIDRILSETDAPFLAPQKYRGDINEPAMVVEIGHQIAETKFLSFHAVSEQMHINLHSFLNQ
ncbi:MAG TPA: YchF/TatD family DNA exonuclease [Candidatus Dojkabacteria bacterium]|nr:YchF/TatD family DNA exonuclease [Candidatus Dojkabacteria bacterium]